MSELALVLIDVQKGIDDPRMGTRNNPAAEENIAAVLALWRERKLPIVHVQHSSTEPQSPLRPDSPGHDFKSVAVPAGDEPVFEKTVNSAFIGTGLESWLRERKINKLLVVGLTTEHCVSTSVRMADNLGFNVTLVGDATASHGHTGADGGAIKADDVYRINLASLHGEFCTVVTTQSILDS